MDQIYHVMDHRRRRRTFFLNLTLRMKIKLNSYLYTFGSLWILNGCSGEVYFSIAQKGHRKVLKRRGVVMLRAESTP